MSELKKHTSSSVILSLFKRKGGEGVLTKIINDENANYFDLLYHNLLNSTETPLIIYYKNEIEWILFTNERIVESNNNIINYADIQSVNLAIEAEYANGVTDKANFTKLLIIDNENNKYLIELEKGKPFWGIYQVLSFV